ncbi:CLUMA_CG009057, isoform A [Clunio marinus]|uniref:CLUMA_CG009057, isoform A n=1 Tax=Clunio marinus TaxID=568069 RepID=A0A1J1I9F1_9DIPT|nr:CLUMA_CG009057, isoform A [Clunio marinus]
MSAEWGKWRQYDDPGGTTTADDLKISLVKSSPAIFSNRTNIDHEKVNKDQESVNEDLSLRNNHFLSVPSPPKHLLTTEEEKQLVKDIIDINNENFMHQNQHQSVNQLNNNQNNASSFLLTPIASGSQFVTVTTLGNHNHNHNSNFQPADHRHKILSHQEVSGSFSQTSNGNFVIINSQQATVDSSHQPPTTPFTSISNVPTSTTPGPTPGRYICPYCQLNCAKPSVLQKHIRAHTNERPYPCTLCGFAFKTKSNLYKHCRSRAHIQRCNGETDPTSALIANQNDEDGCSLESGDIDEAESTQLETTTPLVVSSAPPTGTGVSTPSTPSTPSFFSTNAGQLTPQIIEERISKIISDNEAIIDKVEALLQKKYHKITGIQRHLSTSSSTTSCVSPFSTGTELPPQSNSKLALALLKQQQQQKIHDEEILRYHMSTQQPLNLIKINEPLTVDVGTSANCTTPRKRYLIENPSPLVITSNQQQQEEKPQTQVQATQLVVPASHPQNPEGSIIKDLLLNSKNFGAVDGETGDGSYTCPTCKLSFRGADILKYHLICHCQGEENILSRSAPISPSSSISSPYYPRSSSEKHSPTSLSQLASSQLKVGTSRNPSSLQKLAKSQLKAPKHKPDNITINPSISAIKPNIHHQAVIKNPLPSPGPLLGNTRLVDKRSDDEFGVIIKKPKLEYPSISEAKMQTLFGGDMKIFQEKTNVNSKNFPSGGSFVEGPGPIETLKDTSPNMMRQGLSGGIALELKKESPTTTPGNGPPPVTPKLIVTITPTLAPTLTTNSMFGSGKSNHFQFPSSVTVYNPLTLPLMSTATIGTQSIVHGGRVIPYVPGIPGPNTTNVINKNDLPPPPAPIKDKRMNSPSMKMNGMMSSLRDASQIMPRPNGVMTKKKSFNFARIADNIDANRSGESKKENNLIVGESQEDGQQHQQEVTMKSTKSSFLRPTSLPLKPGTFTPKQHHGITPTANTLPLISPETPRPSKSCVQMYLNGHAYTYLGLKSSTKTFYCTVNKPQPVYIQNQHKLSMYSNWQIYNGNNPNILDLTPYTAMSLYDSRQKSVKFSVANDKKELVSLVELTTTKVATSIAPSNYQITQVPVTLIKDENAQTSSSGGSSVTGYDNSEEYTYIRGRGRGKYVCQECGIRCKKPSMLKKHIRTHTDLRPYTCSHCEFSFKTKGNLTKHMKSKAHFKKCSELGISPIPTMPDDDANEFDDNGNTDESKSRMPEHEAAQLLLSLSNHSANSNNSTNQSNSQQVTATESSSNEQVESHVERSRVILSTLKSGDFDLLNHEKYYSDPNLNRPKEAPQIVQASESHNDNDDDAVPMDLTKKPAKQESFKRQIPTIRVAVDVLPKFSEPALLINQLVSNIEKMPSNSIIGTNINFTDNIQYNESLLPQEYLTERALKDVRMKQSQQNDYNQSAISLLASSGKDVSSGDDKSLFIRQNNQSIVATSSKNGLMDALADLASKSDKLEVKLRSEDSMTSTKTNNANAKNVASEYLKLTQQKIPRATHEESTDGMSDQETPAILLTPQTVVVGEDGFHKKVATSTNIAGNDQLLYSHLQDDTGRPVCVVCSKVFQKASQLRIHMNIHYMERKYRCEACGVSFRTQGHLQKHEKSASHQNKVNMTSTFGVPSVSNPRPFKCKDCKIAFRIHGHLAKHLRSKMHVLKLECLQKLPFGTYAEMERSGFNLTDIDTSDCDNSLMSLRQLAKKLNEKDPSKLGPLPPLSHDDPADCDENGMNENYDSDSSDLGANTNYDDEIIMKRRAANDSDEADIAKRVKLSSEMEQHQVPSNSAIVKVKADD